MMRGEFESLGAIHSVLPTFVPRPVSWGAFRSKPNTFYTLTTFHERAAPARDAAAFCAELAKLHTRSRAPDGRFGFPVATFFGEVLNERQACDSWEAAFTAGLRHILGLEEEVNGVDDALAAAREELIARVVPRLLRPLETAGRRLRPALVHGDLRLANAGVVEADEGGPAGRVMVFRPAAMYAHNEYELGLWRSARNGFDSRFLRTYLKLVPISEPKADFEDRNALYSLRHVVACSIRYPGSAKYRSCILEEMTRLVARFSPPPDRALSTDDDAAMFMYGYDENDETKSGSVVAVSRNGSMSEKTSLRARGLSNVAGRFVRR